jgi:hypothetical protein
VLDQWFEQDVRPRLKGNSIFVRYADDSVMAFEVIRTMMQSCASAAKLRGGGPILRLGLAAM